MSATWGGLVEDWTHVLEGPTERPTEPTISTDAGAWPEAVDVEFYADGSMTVPGMGNPGKRCGEWYPQEFCDECGEPHFGVSRCEQRTCPNCWGAWSRRRAEKITRRLGAARYAGEEPLDKRAVHAVASPPEGSVRTLADVQGGFRDAYELAKEKGIRGGVTIFHGYRVRKRTKKLFAGAVEAGKWDPDEDGKLWAFVRQREKRMERGISPAMWRDLTYWSPHWHILGLARDVGADDPTDQDGWVFRRIRSLEPFSLHDDEPYQDMVGAARYLLSHATFETDSSKDCVRWFGELATTQFSPEEELSEGALAVIERKAREAAGAVDKRGEGPSDDETEPCEECGATSRSPIWEAGGALMDQAWCDRIGREQQRRLKVAFEWAIGEQKPPPGMVRPQSKDAAIEAFEAML